MVSAFNAYKTTNFQDFKVKFRYHKLSVYLLEGQQIKEWRLPQQAPQSLLPLYPSLSTLLTCVKHLRHRRQCTSLLCSSYLLQYFICQLCWLFHFFIVANVVLNEFIFVRNFSCLFNSSAVSAEVILVAIHSACGNLRNIFLRNSLHISFEHKNM